eukprot:gene4760-21036_t
MSSEEEDERHTESLGAETQQFDDAASEDGDDGAGAADTAAASTIPWAKLLDLGGIREPHDINVAQLKVGRKQSLCKYYIADKIVSSHHFTIDRGHDQRITITDTSTNGTSVNSTPLVKGVPTELHSGDEILLCGKPKKGTATVPRLVFHISRKRPVSSKPAGAGAGAGAGTPALASNGGGGATVLDAGVLGGSKACRTRLWPSAQNAGRLAS